MSYHTTIVRHNSAPNCGPPAKRSARLQWVPCRKGSKLFKGDVNMQSIYIYIYIIYNVYISNSITSIYLFKPNYIWDPPKTTAEVHFKQKKESPKTSPLLSHSKILRLKSNLQGQRQVGTQEQFIQVIHAHRGVRLTRLSSGAAEEFHSSEAGRQQAT